VLGCSGARRARSFAAGSGEGYVDRQHWELDGFGGAGRGRGVCPTLCVGPRALCGEGDVGAAGGW
jgi:hypothetical protein